MGHMQDHVAGRFFEVRQQMIIGLRLREKTYQMRSLKIFLSIAALGWIAGVNAQIGGQTTYTFLQFSPSARIAGLGGNLITVKDDDIALAYHNPAALNPTMHKAITFQHTIHLAGINHGYVGTGWHFDKLKTTFQGGIQYAAYGDFKMTDNTGQVLGNFKASDIAINVGAGRHLGGNTSVGANLRFVTSRMESYTSTGMALDLAACYQDTAKRFVASIVLKNIGGQFSTYSGKQEPIPFDLQVGISKKLKHLPLRFSIIGHNLHRWGIRYDDPYQRQTNLFVDPNNPTGEDGVGAFFDEFFRHFIFNGEFLFGKKENLRLRVGYNHLRRAELSVPGLSSLAGFSFGFGMKISKFRLDYSFAGYHAAGGAHQFGISTNLRDF